jgi:integrase
MSNRVGSSAVTASAGFEPDELVLPVERRIAEGPSPRFGDYPRWDLRAGGLTPNLSVSSAALRFDEIPEDWLRTAKTIAMAMLQPTHPVVRAAGIFRSNRPYKLKTARIFIFEFGRLANWAESVSYTSDLSQWTDDECNRYLETVRNTRAASGGHAARDVFRHLADFGALINGGGLQAPIGLTNSGRTSSGVKTPVIPPGTFWPLVGACWTYLDVFANDIMAARDEIENLDHHTTVLHRPSSKTIDDAIDNWLSSPDGFVPLHTYTLGRGQIGEINWDGVALCLTPRVKPGTLHGPPGPARRQRILDAIGRGFPTRFGFTKTRPTEVDRPDGSRGPWVNGFDRVMVAKELTQLRNAAYIFVATMTMMRDSEVQGITRGSVRSHYGAPAVESVLYKGRGSAGTRERWWVSEPVVRALEIAEHIARDPDDRLFGSRVNGRRRELIGFDQHEQIREFVTCVNGNSAQNGLDPIPNTGLAPHMFRRTMAVITANEPDGEIALGITLKHNAVRALANVTTAGYGATSPEWAKEFEHEAKEVAAGELVSEWSRHAHGEPFVRGPGGATFINGLQDVTAKAKTTVAIGNERMIRDLLRDEFATIRLGTLNHCLGDPGKALCLENATAAAKAGGPIPSMCQPANCRNSVVTDKHIPIWRHEEEDLTKKLRDKKMAAVHRERLKTQLAEVQKITRQEPK